MPRTAHPVCEGVDVWTQPLTVGCRDWFGGLLTGAPHHTILPGLQNNLHHAGDLGHRYPHLQGLLGPLPLHPPQQVPPPSWPPGWPGPTALGVGSKPTGLLTPPAGLLVTLLSGPCSARPTPNAAGSLSFLKDRGSPLSARSGDAQAHSAGHSPARPPRPRRPGRLTGSCQAPQGHMPQSAECGRFQSPAHKTGMGTARPR